MILLHDLGSWERRTRYSRPPPGLHERHPAGAEGGDDAVVVCESRVRPSTPPWASQGTWSNASRLFVPGSISQRPRSLPSQSRPRPSWAGSSPLLQVWEGPPAGPSRLWEKRSSGSNRSPARTHHHSTGSPRGYRSPRTVTQGNPGKPRIFLPRPVVEPPEVVLVLIEQEPGRTVCVHGPEAGRALPLRQSRHRFPSALAEPAQLRRRRRSTRYRRP